VVCVMGRHALNRVSSVHRRRSLALAIEAAGSDVIKNGMGEQMELRERLGSASSILNEFPNLRRADFNLKPRQNEEGSALSHCVVQQIRLKFGTTPMRTAGPCALLELNLCRLRKRLKHQAVGQGGPHAFKLLTRAGSHNQWRDEGNLGSAMPSTQPQERVGAHEAKQNATQGESCFQTEKGFQGEVGLAGGMRGIGERNLETFFAGNGQPRHGDAIFKAGGRSRGLERLRANWNKEDSIELKRLARRPRHRQMTEVGRIETAPKEGDSLTGCRSLHLPMLTPRRAAPGEPKRLSLEAEILLLRHFRNCCGVLRSLKVDFSLGKIHLAPTASVCTHS